MFISEAEANKRLNSSENVLTVIDKNGGSRDGRPSVNEPLVIHPTDIVPDSFPALPSAPAAIVPEVLGVDETPDSATLRKMLGMKNPTGRKVGVPNRTREEQASIALAGQVIGQAAAARLLGTTKDHAHDLAHGFTSGEAHHGTGPYEGITPTPNADLVKVIDKQKKQVRDLAFEKLTKTLGLITDDKLEAVTDATKLSRVAKDLSGVVEKVIPKEQGQMDGVHFHIWRPPMREEDSYEQVSVGSGQ